MKDLIQQFARLSPAKQALLIQQLQSKLEAQERLQVEPIAIIGMSCRFPGDARTPQSFWKFLSDGGDAITEVPPDRWDWRATCDSEPMTLGKINTRWGGFLSEVADFDAQAFGLSPREAERMDPQQRLLLELAWEALEDAGVAIERLRATRTGVFIGCSSGEYVRLQFGESSQLDALVGTGNAPSMIASRISYWFDLRGPSLAIDTACSSSLVAAHFACQSLRRGESTLALVGGVNVILMPEPHIIFSRAGLLAPDGRCKVFDERADGYVRSEGAGLVVLKPLSKALADGDSIYAVIRSSAVNQDGRSNGITSPNRQAQESVLREAYRDAGISPGEIQYVEAHGTGTALGDLIEAQALGAILSTDRPPGQSCLIGSVKSNIGHLESAAGIAGLIKVALALKHKEIPPSLHFERPNPQIPFDALSLRVVQRLTPWPEGMIPSRAGVSAFSFGGTNAHLVLEESPPVSPSGQSRPWHVLMLSAKTGSALESVTTNLINYLKQNSDSCLADLAYTLQTGRSFYNHRRMVVCRSVTEATSALETLDPVKVFTTVSDLSGRPAVFMFPGLGEHYVHMAGGLYQAEPVFRSEVDNCCEQLKSSQGLDLRALLFGAPRATNESGGLDLRRMLRRGTKSAVAEETELNRTEVAQPAVFVIEYALAKWLMKLGVRPQAMIGHSLGEYVAACVAGVFSLADGLRLVSERARLIEELPGGMMLAVAMGEEEVKPYLGSGVSLAAVNGPQMCVLSGAEAEMEEVERKLEEREVAVRRLLTSHAFHSEQMREIAEPFRRLLRDVELKSPEIPYVSNVTGKWIRDEEARSVEYWERHLCETVRFGDGVGELLSGGERVMVEVGPGQSLSSFVKLHPECGPEQAGLVVASLRAESERESDEWYWKKLMGKLWLSGVELEWKGLYEGERRSRVPLPTYPFERQRYWIEASRVEPERVERRGGVSRKAEVKEWFYRLGWRERELPEWSEGEVESGREGGWLVFLDDEEEGAALMRRLEERGCEVVSVRKGERFARLSESEYVIDGRESGDYLALIEELSREGKSPREIVHLWNVGRDRGVECESERFEREQERGFYSLIYLARALEEQKEPTEIQITVISSGVQRVTGRERLYPGRATMLGPCKVIPQEYLSLRCRSVDLSDEEKSVDVEGGLWDRLMEECLRRSTDVVIAYRDGKRYVQSVERIRDEEMVEGECRLREGGVYLITGGLGEIGMALAEYLGESVRAKLVLTGRSAFPERESWDEWLESHGAEDEVSGKIRKLMKLEEQGAEALVVSADVGDEEQMSRALKLAEEKFGELAGVIHGAGIVTPDAFVAMRNLSRSECERHFHPKARGVQVIEKLLRGRKLDFCLLLSSLSPLLGGVGYVAYSAANCYLDSFVQQPTKQSETPWISLNLEHWQNTELKYGMPAGLGKSLAALGITPDEGKKVFHRIFSTDLGSQITVSSGDLQARIDQWVRFESLRTTSEETRTGSLPKHPGRHPQSVYAPEGNEIEKQVAAIFQNRLGLKQMSLDDNFFDLGGNSLIALQIITDLRREFDLHLPTVALFEAPTIRGLATYIGTRVGIHQPQPLQTLVKQRVHGVNQREVAIIGMSGRFPGAGSIDGFWQNLADGVESLTFFSDEELKAAGVDPRLLNHPNYVKARPIITDCELFDARFFGYNPRDAELTDPQHRLFLECAWEAMENGGYDSENYDGQIGVFAGTNISRYWLSFHSDPEIARSLNIYQIGVSNDKDSMTANVSYKLNLRGPSLAVQTHCSTSLVAVHLACQSIFTGECDMALAGGSSIIVPQKVGYLYDGEGMDSPDGRTRTFDAQGQGTSFGDAVAVVLLKRLADALEDGDTIYAVIKGSAINNDGSLKVGFTAPSVEGQAEVVATALSRAGVDIRTISYIEAHGAATKLGDPIEVSALTKAFRTGTKAKGFCAIGSVKSNVGHLDKAAGVTGLIKAALALKHRLIPPSLNFESPNPEIDFENSPFYVNTKLSKWESNGHPRRAGVNSLGMGGTNAHVVLEEAPAKAPSGESKPYQMLVLSAKTDSALERMTENLADYLHRHPEVNLADVAFTLQFGRRAFNHRRVVVCQGHDQAIKALRGLNHEQTWSRIESGRKRPVVMMFPGLGEHYVNMAGGLYQAEPVFRSEVDNCCEQLKSSQGLDLKALLFGAPRAANETIGLDLRRMLRRGTKSAAAEETELNRTEAAQPAVFVIEYALAKWLMKLGVRPQAMIGHSLGEYVAACVAGVFSLADGLRLVSERARLIEELPGGMMLAVAMGEEGVKPYLGSGVSLAAVNGPQMCVLSGAEAEMEEVERKLEEREVAVRRLPTRHAFHSERMREIAEPFRRLLRDVELKSPEIPYVSNVTGKWIRDEEARSVEYWERHLCETVRFGDGVGELLSGGERVMVEVGPGQSLSSFVKLHPECGPEQAGLVVASLRAESELGEDEWYWKKLMGKLWLSGVELEWKGLYEGERRSRVPLPTYPFERQRYWIEASRVEPERVERRGGVSRKAEVKEWFYRLGWRERELPEWSEGEVESGREGGWLVFLDEGEVGAGLMRRLEERGCEVVSVRRGERFARLSESEYVIDGRESGDYLALIEELSREGKSPREIVHLWNVEFGRGTACESEGFDREQERGFYSLIYLAQALERQEESAEIQITVISSGVQRVTGRERLCPGRATLLGPCKVIPQEYLSLRCRSVDLSDEEKSVDVEGGLWDRVMEECLRRSTDVVIAYRDGKRYAQSVEPIRDEEMIEVEGRLREGGAYLITGGLGSIGMTLAEYLGKSVRAKLVLTGRSAFPERDIWDEWVERFGAEDEVSGKILKLRELEERGAEVLVVSADVGDEEQMSRALKLAEEKFGELAGVIHGAGIVSPDAFVAMHKLGRSECERHFHPKARGAQVIEKLLRGRKLDFCLLLSSLSSFWGGLGSVAYTAACIFLDSMAQQPRLPGAVPWLSVNLDAWQPLRKEDGLSNLRIGPAAFGMAPAEGIQVFHRIFNTNLGSQVAVSSADLQARIDQWSQLESLRTTRRTTHPRPVLGTAYVEPSNEMESRITKIWQELLGLDQVGVEDNFFELGGHSLLATQLFSRLRAEFDVEISVRNIFEMATVTRQAELIATIRWATQAPDLLTSSETPLGAMIEGEL